MTAKNKLWRGKIDLLDITNAQFKKLPKEDQADVFSAIYEYVVSLQKEQRKPLLKELY